MDPNKKLQVCKETRKIATDALAKALRKSLRKNRISEKEFRPMVGRTQKKPKDISKRLVYSST